MKKFSLCFSLVLSVIRFSFSAFSVRSALLADNKVISDIPFRHFPFRFFCIFSPAPFNRANVFGLKTERCNGYLKFIYLNKFYSLTNFSSAFPRLFHPIRSVIILLLFDPVIPLYAQKQPTDKRGATENESKKNSKIISSCFMDRSQSHDSLFLL